MPSAQRESRAPHSEAGISLKFGLNNWKIICALAGSCEKLCRDLESRPRLNAILNESFMLIF